jgi:hypothetical protein
MQNTQTVTVPIQILPGYAAGLQELTQATGQPVEEILALIVPRISVMIRNRCDDLTPNDFECAVSKATNDKIREIRKQRRMRRTVEMRLNVSASSYGILCQAAIVWDCSPQKALDHYVNDGDMLCEWSNDDFRL